MENEMAKYSCCISLILFSLGCSPAPTPEPIAGYKPTVQVAPNAPEKRSAAPTERHDTFAAARVGSGDDPSRVIERVERAVVKVTTSTGSMGSGFVVQNTGIVATNYHVIHGARSVSVTFSSGDTIACNGFCYLNERRDLIFLVLESLPKTATVLNLAEDLPKKGQRVYAFGAPQGLEGSVTDGIVSSIRTGIEVRQNFREMTGTDVYAEVGYGDNMTWIQCSAPISPGNSGGPLVDSNGEVVGVNTWNRAGQNLNFAVAARHVKEGLQPDSLSFAAFSTLPSRPSSEIARVEPSSSPGTGSVPERTQPSAPNRRADRTITFWGDFMRARVSGSFVQLGRRPSAEGFLANGRTHQNRAVAIGVIDAEGVDPELIAFAVKNGRDELVCAECCSELARACALYYDSSNPNGIQQYNVVVKVANSTLTSLQVDNQRRFQELRLSLSAKYERSFPDYMRLPDSEPTKANVIRVRPVDASDESRATAALNTAKSLGEKGSKEAAIKWLRKVIDEYPDTPQAIEAAKLLAAQR